MGKGLGSVELVGREEHRGTRRNGLAGQPVEEVAPVLVETGVWLVQQPELGAAGQQAGQRGPATLSG